MSKKSKKVSKTPVTDWAFRTGIATINPDLNKYDKRELSPKEKEIMRRALEMLKAPGLPKEFYEKK